MANRDFNDWTPYVENPGEFIDGHPRNKEIHPTSSNDPRDPDNEYTPPQVHEIHSGEQFRIWRRYRCTDDGEIDQKAGQMVVVDIVGGADEIFGKHMSKLAATEDYPTIMMDYVDFIKAMRREGRL